MRGAILLRALLRGDSCCTHVRFIPKMTEGHQFRFIEKQASQPSLASDVVDVYISPEGRQCDNDSICK